MTAPTPPEPLAPDASAPSRRRNRRLALGLSGIVLGMVLLAYASVPLYRLFCQITGIGGTTQQATSLPDRVLDRTVTVRFNADTSPVLGWEFRPLQPSVTVRMGESGLAFYEATNRSDQPLTGMSTFNVTPHKVGQYFVKVHCFCFEEQPVQPGETVRFPVSFYIDPAMDDDRRVRDVHTITLSYTFFKATETTMR